LATAKDATPTEVRAALRSAWRFGALTVARPAGIIPRAAELIYDEMRRMKNVEEYNISCSFLEIYKEK
jgi:hypothetical protein